MDVRECPEECLLDRNSYFTSLDALPGIAVLKSRNVDITQAQGCAVPKLQRKESSIWP